MITLLLLASVGCAQPAASSAEATDPRAPDAGSTTPPEQTSLEVGAAVAPGEDGLAEPARSSKVVVIWDAPRGRTTFPYKQGEGAVSEGRLSLRLAGPPPDEVLVDGALAVGNLVLVAPDLAVPDGELSLDQADALLAGTVAVMQAVTVIYRVDDSARYPWASSFPRGLSCARPDGVGFAPAPCAPPEEQTRARLVAPQDGSLPLAPWQAPPAQRPHAD